MSLFESSPQARRFLRTLGIVFTLTWLAIVAPVRSFQVSGGSMQPSLLNGERILVEQITPRFHPIRRGDVIVFQHPSEPGRFLVKRVVGLGGETIEIRRGAVIVNGSVIPEAYLPRDPERGEDQAIVRLGDEELFVLGDHRSDSEDSRSWGPLPLGRIVGRAVLAYWPPSKAGTVG